MTVQSKRAARASAERELLARFGLQAGATDQEVEAAHDAIVQFLETAPHDLNTWARHEAALIDEAYAFLSDDAVDLAALGDVGAEPHPPAPIVAEPVRTPARRAVAGAAPRAAGRRLHLGPVTRVLIAAVALVGAVTVGYVVYASGAPAVPGTTAGTPAPEASASPAIDAARVTTLMQKIAADPKDTASLLELGNIYFDAGDYKSAGDFMAKVVAIDPKNVDALVGLGAAVFNQGDSTTAEADWRKAIAINPKKQEAYYDLGFMYLSKNPPDMANVTAMWDKVLAIDPTTDIAKTVKTHLDSFASSSASPGASPADAGASASPAAPAASGTPGASPATPASAAPASPTPSGS